MRYHNITKDDMLNGDGLRVVLWVSGCRHRCKGCQNPVTWDENDGLVFDEEAKREIFEELSKDYIAGITFSGGDPLHEKNLYEITNLSREIKTTFPEKSIWLYTGADWEEVMEKEIFEYVDVCIDGEFIENKKDEKLLWKGSSNQRVIDVNATRELKEVVLFCADYEEEQMESVRRRESQCER